jgi:hypothetical protein
MQDFTSFGVVASVCCCEINFGSCCYEISLILYKVEIEFFQFPQTQHSVEKNSAENKA